MSDKSMADETRALIFLANELHAAGYHSDANAVLDNNVPSALAPAVAAIIAALSSVKGVREEALEEAAAKLDANATNAESDLIRATIRLQAAAIRSLAQTGSGE